MFGISSQKSATQLAMAAVAALVFVMPMKATTCLDAQYSAMGQGSYELQNDEWGLSDDPTGWEEICSGSSTTNSWSATWNWAEGTNLVKAYPGIYIGWQDGGEWSPATGGFPVVISVQDPIPTSVTFSMTGKNEYDDAYDLFFSPSSDPSTPSAEMMVWLNYSGDQPAGTKVASAVTLGGVSGTWDVWEGNVGWPVWSFVRDSQVNTFSANLQPFIYYCAYTKGWLNPSWFVLDVQFGTEIKYSYGANGSMTVTSFSAAAN
ncbi:MAG: hypothetical protein ABR905_08565 [Terracidiphilus sp.]|jgi:hypothetical protein